MNYQTNNLKTESSPYLLQHAANPVHWQAWSDKLLEKTRNEGKLLIISIGYSACHWCHVMEKESFEDTAIAALMNKYFISIKIDREERPDVDQVYMTALQLMTGQGGWPLNIIALPDGRPIWGATYLPPQQWKKAIQSVAEIYRDEPEKVLEYADKLEKGIQKAELIETNSATANFDSEEADTLFFNWQNQFDSRDGGNTGAPKFPMPANAEFLLHYGTLNKNIQALSHLELTLNSMARGGIYDQLGGGFARYSTDAQWIVPHFEKMLYDNAQLISLYSKAYRHYKNPLYKKVVEESIEWIQREMTGTEGQFYSALDADSEGVEGRYYVWGLPELKAIIPLEDWQEFENYFDLKKGKWEEGIILLRNPEVKVNLEKESEWKKLLLPVRNKRTAPGLDDKVLCSWNALMITALLDAYVAVGTGKYLQMAVSASEWLRKNYLREGNALWHTAKGRNEVEGLLEDYAFAIEAWLKLYEVSFNPAYLIQAQRWIDFTLRNFSNEENGLFYTRNIHSPQLIARSLETSDNVIPSANAVMADNLFRMGHLLQRSDFTDRAAKMLMQVKDRAVQYGASYSRWASLLLHFSHNFYEVVIYGPEAEEYYKEWVTNYQPNILLCSSEKISELPLFRERYVEGETFIYVCRNSVCQLPVKEIHRAKSLLE